MRTWTAVVAATALALTLAACGSDDGDDAADDPSTSASASETASETPSPAPSATPPPVDPPAEPSDEPVLGVTITINGDDITPSGERIEVDRDQPVVLEITSDRAGELHVHSKPEQYVEFEAGTSQHELVVGVPGIVDVEEHETGHVVVQLEVR